MTDNPLVPEHALTVHIVLDDLGRHGCVYREMSETEADFETLVEDILAGQYYSPRRIVAFNTERGWARDVTEDVARVVLTRAIDQDRPLLSSVQDFVELWGSGFIPAISRQPTNGWLVPFPQAQPDGAILGHG